MHRSASIKSLPCARRSIDYPAILSDPGTVIRALAAGSRSNFIPASRFPAASLAVRPELREPGKHRFMHRGTKNPARPINRSLRRNPFKYFAFAEPRARARRGAGIIRPDSRRNVPLSNLYFSRGNPL